MMDNVRSVGSSAGSFSAAGSLENDFGTDCTEQGETTLTTFQSGGGNEKKKETLQSMPSLHLALQPPGTVSYTRPKEPAYSAAALPSSFQSVNPEASEGDLLGLFENVSSSDFSSLDFTGAADTAAVGADYNPFEADIDLNPVQVQPHPYFLDASKGQRKIRHTPLHRACRMGGLQHRWGASPLAKGAGDGKKER